LKSRKLTVAGAAMVLTLFSWWLVPTAHAARSISLVTYLVRSDSKTPVNLAKSELVQIYNCTSQFQSSFKPLIPATGAVRSNWLSYLGLSAPGPCVSAVSSSGETITENDGLFLTDARQLVPYDVSAWIDQISQTVADVHGNSILGNIDGVNSLSPGPGLSPTYLVRSDSEIPVNLAKSELVQIYNCTSQFQSSFKPLIPATGAVRSNWLSYLGLPAPGPCVSAVSSSGETITENDGLFLTDARQLVPYDVSAWIDQVSQNVADVHGNSILGNIGGAGALRAGSPIGCEGQTVTPSTAIQQAVDNAPEGTTFCFAPGTYPNVSITPKNGDIFDGQNQTAVLDGMNSAQYAFESSTVANVTIQGFVIRGYNTPLQKGAVQSFGTTGWTISNNHITNNSASGVATGDGARVLNNKIDWNKQEGYAAHGDNILYEGNEIAYNNHDLTIDATWEAGGGKAWETSHATFKNNYVHDNGGNGLWDDTNNIYITYDGNVVTNNWGAGIYHEIGYDATIINNTVSNNGLSTSPGGGQNNGWLWDAGIQLRESGALSASSPILISGNAVTNNYNGISLIESPASGCTNSSLNEGAYGPCHIQNVLVQNNVVTMSTGATGAVQDGEGEAIFASRNVQFIGNTYHIGSTVSHPDDGHTYDWFAWRDDWFNWPQWQAYGNDTNGRFGP
jgi:parallel beta-helix repeat protein